jgi:glycerol-3-phosphate dehydrogenase
VSPPTAYDVVIIGGGINGAGIARDAALRGLKVLLLEQNDFGSGTTSWSSRLIHGGLRYLEHGEIPLVYESLRERRVLQEVAPHLVTRLRINIPVYDHSKRGLLLLRAGMIAYDLLSLGKPLPNHRVLNREQFLRNEPGVNPSGLRGGVQYYDAQLAFAERLVIENVLAAHDAGAVVENYSPVTSIVVETGRVNHVVYRHRENGQERKAQAQIVVNASGPWVDDVLSKTTLPGRKLIGGTKGSHIVVGAFAGAPKDAFYVEARSDGRPFFVIPWNGQYLIGTTDIRYDGDPAEAVASPEEIEYLLGETNRIFPQADLGTSDIHYTYAGVRPLPRRSAGPESAITRKHIIRRHEDAKGLWTVIGGKLTTYRSLAEDAVDRILRSSGLEAGACRTREEPLPGAVGLDGTETAIRRLQVSGEARARLPRIYGSRAGSIFDLMCNEPALAAEAGPGVPAAEVVFAIRFEFARTLIDILHRRTMIGLSRDLGRSAAAGVAAVAAMESGWSEAETEQQLVALRAYNERLTPARNRGL